MRTIEGENRNKQFEQMPTRDIYSEDNATIYLREIGSIPLLTREQEVQLGRKVRFGNQAKERIEEEVISQDELPLLSTAIEDGDMARNTLVHSNLKLVASVAKRYTPQFRMEFLDLVSHGNLALFNAVDGFDPERGFKFSTYATWWIKQGITRAIANESRNVRLPVYLHEDLRALSAKITLFWAENGREPKREELFQIAEMMSPRSSIKGLIQAYDRKLDSRTASLDKEVGGEVEGGGTLGDFVPSDDEDTADVLSDLNREKELARIMKLVLSPEQFLVMAVRHGLDDYMPHSEMQTAMMLEKKMKEIKAIEETATDMLKQNKDAFHLLYEE